jgi:hypothetical protein
MFVINLVWCILVMQPFTVRSVITWLGMLNVTVKWLAFLLHIYSWPGDQLSCLKIFVVFLSPSRQILGYLQLDTTISFHILCSLLFTNPIIQWYTVWTPDSHYIQYIPNYPCKNHLGCCQSVHLFRPQPCGAPTKFA